jgi:hypothetical protein
MGAQIGNPPPLLPRLDLPYFTLLPFFDGNGRQCLFVTAAPAPDDEPHHFEMVAYSDLLDNLSTREALEPLWRLGNTSPALEDFGRDGADRIPFPSAEIQDEIQTPPQRPIGVGLEGLIIVVLRTPRSSTHFDVPMPVPVRV